MKLCFVALPFLAANILFGQSWALPQAFPVQFKEKLEQEKIIFPGQLEEILEEEIISTTEPPSMNLYEKALEKCLDQGDKLPNFDEDKGHYVCHTLLEQGPCAEGEWFVAIPDSQVPFAKCQPRPCDGLDSLVPIEGEKACKLLYGSSDCAPGMELLANPFGKGMYIPI